MWAIHSADYFKAAIVNVEDIINTDVKRLSQYGNGRRPHPPNFHPEIDTSVELD